MNMMQNFVPGETAICDDREPRWINKEIKELSEQKTNFTNDSFKVIKRKFGLLPSQINCFMYLNENPLKLMKNAFYFSS